MHLTLAFRDSQIPNTNDSSTLQESHCEGLMQKSGGFLYTRVINVMTQCQDEFRSLSGCVPEILTACRMLQISIAWCQNDAEIRGFPTMYMNGGGLI